MKNLIIIGSIVLGSFTAFADSDHTEDVCSELNSNVCAHLGHMSKLNSSDEVKFVAHVMTPGDAQISDFQIDLWMQMGDHGHGSSPVKIQQFAVNRFRVTEAYFVMPGQWWVRMKFQLDGQSHQINIPLKVTE